MAIKHNSFATLLRGGVFTLFFFILFLFQSKTVNTGDAGELVTAAFGLGVAHPSGYPLYLILAKFLTFLPFGSIPMKVTLVSSFFGFLIILTGYIFLRNELKFESSAIFYILILLSCYSFVGQTSVAKFYPLNTFIIFLIFLFGYNSIERYSLINQLTISYLLGLSLGLHQTTFIMFVPLTLLIVFHFKQFLKNLPLSLFFFATGAINVVYLIIRSSKDNLLNMSPSTNLESLIYTILRKAYGSSSSVDAVKSFILFDFNKIINAIANISELIVKEFHLYSVLFFLVGLIYLLMRNKKKFFYFLLTFTSYSFLLGYLTFYFKNQDLDSWYIVAHQYYVPMLLFYALISAYGLDFLITLLPDRIRSIKYLAILFPLIYFPNHFFVNYFDKNQVAYYKTIDQFFVKPIKSIVIYSGDNDVFQGWYLKNVEKFRDDICLISAPQISDGRWELSNGCNYEIYKDAYPEVSNKFGSINLASLEGYMKKNRVYSASPIEENKLLNKYVYSHFNLYDFLIYPKSYSVDNKTDQLIGENRIYFEKFSHYDKCLYHGTDDMFTKSLCDKYATYLSFLAYEIGKKMADETISFVDVNFSKSNKMLAINTNNQNRIFLYTASIILQNNELSDFYLFKGER